MESQSITPATIPRVHVLLTPCMLSCHIPKSRASMDTRHTLVKPCSARGGVHSVRVTRRLASDNLIPCRVSSPHTCGRCCCYCAWDNNGGCCKNYRCYCLAHLNHRLTVELHNMGSLLGTCFCQNKWPQEEGKEPPGTEISSGLSEC